MTESYTDISQTSSKFQSGDSTPDVISKFPVISKNLYDILPESINVPDFDTMDCTQPKSSEWKKSLFEYGKAKSLFFYLSVNSMNVHEPEIQDLVF